MKIILEDNMVVNKGLIFDSSYNGYYFIIIIANNASYISKGYHNLDECKQDFYDHLEYENGENNNELLREEYIKVGTIDKIENVTDGLVKVKCGTEEYIVKYNNTIGFGSIIFKHIFYNQKGSDEHEEYVIKPENYKDVKKYY